MKLVLVLIITIFTLPLFAQVDLEEQAKGKLEQQDFNTTRSNKERGGNRNPKKKSRSQTEAMPPPPPAPMPNPEEDSNAIHLEWYQFEFNQQLDYHLINVAPSPRDKIELKMIYGRSACWIEENGNSTITIQDFMRNKLFFVDTLAKTVRISSFEAINSTLETHTFKTTGEKKTIDGIVCLEYNDQSVEKTEQTVIWVAESMSLDVIYQQYRPLLNELSTFHIFVNGKTPVLEQIYHSVGHPLKAMKVTNVEEKLIQLDLTNYTLIP